MNKLKNIKMTMVIGFNCPVTIELTSELSDLEGYVDCDEIPLFEDRDFYSFDSNEAIPFLFDNKEFILKDFDIHASSIIFSEAVKLELMGDRTKAFPYQNVPLTINLEAI